MTTKRTAKKATATTARKKLSDANSAATKKLPSKSIAKVLSSKVAFQGRVFSVYKEEVIEPGDVRVTRDIVRHNGSVVVLAVDDSQNPQDPTVIVIRQFRHAANQFLYELPAGRVDPGEKPLAAAKRELIEETGYRATKWQLLVRYFASPGFVGEWMEIFLATGIRVGTAQPEDDERIELHPMPLSELVRRAIAGEIHDGKTIIGALLYAERLRTSRPA